MLGRFRLVLPRESNSNSPGRVCVSWIRGLQKCLRQSGEFVHPCQRFVVRLRCTVEDVVELHEQLGVVRAETLHHCVHFRIALEIRHFGVRCKLVDRVPIQRRPRASWASGDSVVGQKPTLGD